MVLSSSVVLRINLKESVGIWVESICCRNLAKICRLNVFLVVLLVSVAMENEVAAHVLSFLPLYTVSCLSTVWRARFCKEKVYVLVTPANDPMQNMPENVLAVELPDWMADWDDDTASDPPARCVFCEELESGDSQSEPDMDELGAFNLVYVLRFPLWPFPELEEICRTSFTLSRAGAHVTELQVFCCSACYDMLMQAHHESAEPLNLREVW